MPDRGLGIWGLGFGVWGMGVGVWGLVCGVWGLGFGVWGSGFRVWGSGLRTEGDGFRIRCSVFYLQALRQVAMLLFVLGVGDGATKVSSHTMHLWISFRNSTPQPKL